MTSRRLITIIAAGALFLLVPALAVAQPLSGDYIIGTGQTYTTLGAAITALNTNGASGTVRFLINENLTESGSPEITSTTLNGTNRLVIKPNATKTPTLTFTTCATSGTKANAGLAISGSVSNVGYITIDGSNTVGGTTRDMTFALNDTTNGRFCIKLNGDVDSTTIKNLKITALGIKPTSSSGTRTYGINCLATATAAQDGLTITNCEIGSSTAAYYYAIYKPDGGAAAPYGADLTVSNNVLFAQHKGMSIWGSSGTCTIRGNTVSTTGVLWWPTYVQNSVNGIYAESWLGTLNIYNNKVIGLKAKALSQAATRALYGILVYYASGTGNTGQTANIYNNFISDFTYTGDATTYTSGIDGIAVDARDQIVNVYYNTVYLNGDNIVSNPANGIRVYDDAGMSAYLKNNIVVNTVNHDSAYAIHANPIVNATLKGSDYNDLYVAGANAYTGNYGGTKHKTLANWQSGTSQDANSKSVNPANPFGGAGQLVSLTNLHWVSAAQNVFAGTPIPGFTTDIDGDARHVTNPYMGADEAGPLTGVEPNDPSRLVGFALDQNYPNPFNPSTTIRFSVASTGRVTLRVFDLLGRQLATLVDEVRSPGSYIQTWHAGSVPSGVYFYKLESGEQTITKRMTLLK